MLGAEPTEQIAPQSPRAPSQAMEVTPVSGMQVYDGTPGQRRTGRVTGVLNDGAVVVVHWRDGSRSWASWGGEVAPTSFRGV